MPKVERHIIEASEIVSKLVSLSLASAQIRSLKVVQQHQILTMRPQLHFMILAHSGVGKSSLLDQIEKIEGSEVYTEITGPGLIGSVDRKMGNAVVSGAAWDNRGRLLILDEFRIGYKDNDAIHPLLQLMERGFYKKKIGLMSQTVDFKEPEGSPDPDYFFAVKDGELRLKTRFGAIMASMRDLENDMRSEIMALISRCIPFRWSATTEELSDIANGVQLFIPEKFKIKIVDVVISKKDYSKIKKYVDDIHLDQKIYLRTIGDCCRAFAVIGKHDDAVYDLICRLKIEAQAKHDDYVKKMQNLAI
jgi:hypothetical protein